MAEYREVVKGGRPFPRSDFEHILSTIASKLREKDLNELKFLCEGIIPCGTLEQIGSSQELFKELERQKQLSPNNAEFLVKSLRDIKRVDLADELEEWRNSIKIEDILKRSRIAHKEKKFQKELLLYEEILKLISPGSPTKENVLKKKAACLILQQNFEDALKDCNEVLELNPHDMNAKFLLAKSYGGLEKYSEAYEELKNLSNLWPKDPEILILLKQVKAKIQQKEKLCEEPDSDHGCQADDCSAISIGESYPKNVLFVCDKWSGWHLDIYSVNRHLCRHFAKAGIRVACLVLEALEKDVVLSSKEGISLKTCSSKSGVPDGDYRLFAMHTDFPFKPDIVFGHGDVTGADAAGLAKRIQCKYFHLLYDAPGDNTTTEEIQLGQDADFVAAIGPLIAKEWSNKLNCDVLAIIPGIPSDSKLRNSIPTPHNRALIVDNSNSKDDPGLELVIKALQDCKKRPHLTMEISVQGTSRVKKEELKTKLETELGTLNVKIHVTSVDASSMHVDGEMRAVSLALMPTLSRTFGLRSLECISSGVPVIVSTSHGIADVVIDHFDSRFWTFLHCATREKDYELWSDRIDDFLDRRDQTFELASELKQQWEKTFTWDKATRKILSHLSASGKFQSAPMSSIDDIPTKHLLCSESARNFVQQEVKLHKRRQGHILVVSAVDGTKNTAIRHLAKFPWIAVLDFDENSQETGYLRSCQALGDQVGSKICPIRCPHSQKVKETAALPNGIPWLLIDDKPECLKWLRNVMSTIESSHLEPITILILWNSSQENAKPTRKLEKLLSNIEASSLQERVKLAVALVEGSKEFFISEIEDDWNTEVHEIPLGDVCNAINESLFESQTLLEGERFSLPVAEKIGSGKVVTKILPPESRWIKAELEVLYQSVGDFPDHGPEDAQHFYRGGTISWYALSKGYAIKRTNWDPIKANIAELLNRGGTRRQKLFHSRGTGGTTSSRWILFEFHKMYPCVNVRSIDLQETASAIKVLADFCNLPVLVLIDCTHVLREEFDLDILYNTLSNHRVSCVILEVTHRQETSHKRKKKELVAIAEILDDAERDTFIETYGQLRQERQQRLKSLKRQHDDIQIPFYYALVTYEDKFIALEPFVEDCLKDSSKVQRKALSFLAMSHHYAQMSVPEAALASLFDDAPHGTPLEDLLNEESMHLLLEEEGGWRPRHDLIGKCMVKKLLSIGINEANWVQNLADEAIDFISHMPEKLVSELLKNRPHTYEFSILIDDIPDDDDVIKVFEKAIECFPNNPHFTVHLGRVYSMKREPTGFEMAILYTDEGIKTAERNNSSKEVRGQFAQMKGVVYSRRVNFLIKEEARINDVIPIAEQGVEWFRRSVSICPDVIDGYIPEVSMMCKLFEYIHKTNKDLYRYLQSSECHPFIANGISQTSDTLECVPDSESYSYFKSRLLCLGLRKHPKDQKETLKLLEDLRLNPQISRGPINRKIAYIKVGLCRQSGQDLSTVAADVIEYLREALKYDQNEREKELTMCCWVQIAPFYPVPLSDAEKWIFGWCHDCKSVRSYLYKFIISFIHVLDGSKHYVEKMRNALSDLQNEVKIINRGNVGRLRHPDKPVVWLGHQNANGMGQLVHLGQICKDKRTERKNCLSPEQSRKVRLLTGTIVKIERQLGIISISDNLEVSFRNDLCDPPLSSKTFCERQVQFHLGFKYFGPDAYNVKLIPNH